MRSDFGPKHHTHRSQYSVMPSALGTSRRIPYLACDTLTSGATSAPLSFISSAGGAFELAASLFLYIESVVSLNTKYRCWKAFRVNFLGLNGGQIVTIVECIGGSALLGPIKVVSVHLTQCHANSGSGYGNRSYLGASPMYTRPRECRGEG